MSKKYIPNTLSKKDKKIQKKSIEKSKKLYNKKKYYIRPKLKSFKSKISPHIRNAQKLYKINSIKPSKELAKKTKCSIKGLRLIVKKGQGAYYSSGSRPSQTPHSWGIARLGSAITGGKSAKVDYHILKEYCEKNSKALKLSKKYLKNKKLKGGTMSEPRKNKKGIIIFKDYPEFQPNLTPKEILNMGSFGGTYFRDINSKISGKKEKNSYKEFEQYEWLEKDKIKNYATNDKCNPKINKYNVTAGLSLKEWEDNGWITKIDPYGWFQWYCRFYIGRRSNDDERQIDRWVKYAGEYSGRWRRRLIKMCKDKNTKYDDLSISPVIRQGLQQWAYILTKEDFNNFKIKN